MSSWRVRIRAASRAHTARLVLTLEREFQRLAKSVDAANARKAVEQHAVRLAAIIAAEQRAAALTFGFMALEMADEPAEFGAKADKPTESRAQRVSRVLLEMARTVASGAAAADIAQRLAQNRTLVGYIEITLIANPRATPAAIALELMGDRRVSAAVALVQADVAGAPRDLAAIADALDEQTRARRTSSPVSGGGGAQPPVKPPPAPPGSGGGATPRRSRLSQLMERIVREDAPRRARQIAATSGRAIANVLAQGAREGWGEERTAKALVEALGENVARYRARAIARTELGGAQNRAAFMIALDREAAGDELDKSWAAIDDDRVRPSHADADGQRVPLREPFIVGEARLMHPHDPAAPLGEIINCRCAFLLHRRQSAAAAPG